MVQVVEAFHYLAGRCPGDIAYQQRFGRIAGEGFLAEHMLAGVQCVLVHLACSELTSAL